MCDTTTDTTATTEGAPVRKVLAFVAAVAAAFLLAACGPTTTAPNTSGHASHAPCADADAAQGDPDGDCH
jgi:hypothetical protein